MPFIARPHDFAFLAGRWTVANRRLRTRHVGSDDWDEFEGFNDCRDVLDGVASLEEIAFPTRGFAGATVRALDLAAGRWSIWWINSGRGVLEPPVHGGFDGERGEFYGDDTDEGRPVKVRFVWTRTPDAPRWEQAFSIDGGRSWETNWIMQFRRAG